MSEILNTYPIFERNQVLTSTQLNNLVSYLDQQNRLTRARLIGMGVVCGLEIKYDAGNNKITISKGTGITSEGYLVNLGECLTVKYRPYILPPGTIYAPFVGSDNKQDIALYELLTDKAGKKPDDELLDDEAFLNDKVVLLFIESFDKDLKSCLGKNCDELGKDRILTLRKLLVGKADLQTVWDRTNTGKLDAVFPEKFDLPVVNLPRVLFNPNETHSTGYTDFSTNYASAVLAVFDKLVDALSETYDTYRSLLHQSYGEKNPFENEPLTTKLATLQNFLNDSDATFTSYLGIQYVYDLFQDLILAYNEFKNTAFDLISECVRDMSRFPRHLMLGEAIPPSLSLCEKSEFRHYFIQPPIYNLQKLLVQRTIALHNRLVLMLESFDLKRINGEAGDEAGFPIRITPSLEKTTPLSSRSIPWYYNVLLESSFSNLGKLKDFWNFDIARKCLPEQEGLILNYDGQAIDQSTAKDKLSTPLFFDIQDYTFLRIEGQTGKDFGLALSQINILKTKFNLPFNIVALQLDTNAGTLALDYNCSFEDIQEEYIFLKSDFCGFTKDIVRLYSFVEKNQDLLFDGENNDNNPAQHLEKIKAIVDVLKEICEALPDCFHEFDFAGFQRKYKFLLDETIGFFLIDLELLQKINIRKEDAVDEIPLINGLIQRLSPLAYKIVDLLFYKRFLRLYYSFKRREFYLIKDTGVFSAFIRKHPGIDHQAGVPKGGTFILVYVSSEEKTVIADFNLPYLCCGADNCVPMCEKDGGFTFEWTPFARPDYAVTLIDTAVEIDVLRNDINMFGANLIIQSNETSEFGGGIQQTSETGPLIYKPKSEFTGTDTFVYEMINKDTGASDKATVTVVVKQPDQVSQGCYSIEILQCWGEKEVLETLRFRKIPTPQGADIFELLLSDLRKTGGFTNEEIRSEVLKNPDRRRRLLNCLDIPNDDNTSNEQLEQLILDYQKQNCGVVVASECYNREILSCWGNQSIILFLRTVGLNPGNDPVAIVLDYLRKNRGFSGQEVNFLLENGTLFGLLKCIFSDISEDMSGDEMKGMLLDYQSNNCQGTSDDVIRVAVDLELLPLGDMRNVLEAREIRVSTSELRDSIENALDSSINGNALSESELTVLSRNTITNILDSRNIPHTTRENKTQLIRKLFNTA